MLEPRSRGRGGSERGEPQEVGESGEVAELSEESEESSSLEREGVRLRGERACKGPLTCDHLAYIRGDSDRE